MFGHEFDQIEKQTKGIVFNIEHFHVHDGEGIRTNVFLKGCSLHCVWCCNPESIGREPQIAYYRNLCTGCGTCVKVCPEGCCDWQQGGRIGYDMKKCIACGRCAEACPSGARELFGKVMSVADVMNEVEKDSFYFLNSEGGITLSGGEACLQPEFASEIIRAAHRRYIPAAVETAAAVPWEKLWTAVQDADEILFDLKTTSSEKFREKIGSFPLEIVKNNLKELRKHDKKVTLRCPIIPGFNDEETHICGIAQIASKNGIKQVDLLPFHQFGRHKYAAIGRNYQMELYPEMDREKVEQYAEILRKEGFSVSVGG